jgi:PAS domain S-box-containing protein
MSERPERTPTELSADDLRGRLAAIVDSSDDAIVSKTLEGVITSWNRGAERIFGWSAAEAIGRHITLIIPKDRHPKEDDVLARIRRGEIVDHYETVRVTKDGRLVDISLTVSPVKDAMGRIIGASKIARDITARRRLEEERDRLLILERQAREEAEASNRTRDQLMALVSHELRTPLNAVMGWARMLQNGDLDEGTRSHAVEVIIRNASTQAQLIEDLLDLSRIVTARMRLTFEKCEVTKCVDEALDAVRPTADAKGVTLVTMFAPDVGPILGAPDRLRQVVWNLAMNAVKFTPPGGRVEVAVTRSEQNAQVVVTDNGVGISPAVLPHVFEPFRQEDSSSTRAHSGLGLGLALVKHVIELHGGTVHAQSPGKGKGARFTVTIPIRTATEDRSRDEYPVGHGHREAPTQQSRRSGSLGGLSVLVVDDDDASLDYVATALRTCGATAITASSALDGLRLLQERRPHVVLSDVAMAGQDGYWLLREIRGLPDEAARRVPVVATTAYGREHSRERVLATGFSDLLPKPVDPELLCRTIGDTARREARGDVTGGGLWSAKRKGMDDVR